MSKTADKEHLWENMNQLAINLREGEYVSGFDLAEEELLQGEMPSNDDDAGATDSIEFCKNAGVMETIQEEREEEISAEDAEVERIMSRENSKKYANEVLTGEESKESNLSIKEQFAKVRVYFDFENYPVDTPVPEETEVNEANDEFKANADITTEKEETNTENTREVDIYDFTNRRVIPELKTPFLTPYEQLQVESVFRGLKTKLFLCNCEARMYGYIPTEGDWTFEHIGVLVLVLEKGTLTNTIWLLLAERGTGLAIWRDKINFNTMYTRTSPDCHMMSLSWNHSWKVGFKFDEESEAENFYLRVVMLTSCLENIGVSLPKDVKAKLPRKKKTKRPSKSSISWPCCFTHITSLTPSDRSLFRSMENLVGVNNTQATPQRSFSITSL
ncbi:uncharacterized protein LOC124369036 [Homalodisca vitripennis]|uniref:uncharacterized protein LOC124369036 n=1 Tax=Homalodisca vitripennis TaxID=197043 RepID=UPI001EE9F0A1|nr:uncharacterized protein LOC124369036 [Homalodisca vitripennis]KAG8251809.1 hypothetical protein J6590_071848 [Homalodisca vitripennis]